jgi:sodium transport system permease protein
MAVAIIAMISVLLQITGLLLAIEFLASGFLTMPEVSVIGWLLFIASVLLFAIFTVAIELAVAIRAKSVKEAGSTLAPMILLFLGPTLFSQFVNLEGIELWWFIMPIFNVCLGMREALIGVHEPMHIAAWAISSLVYALAAVIWASRQFNREDLVESIS